MPDESELHGRVDRTNQIDAAPSAAAAEIADVTALLIDLGAALHASAMPTDAVEQRVGEVAEAEGVEARILLLQSALFMDVGPSGRDRALLRRIDFEYHWNLIRLEQVVEVSDALAGREISTEEGRAKLRSIRAAPKRYGVVPVSMGYGIYGAAVAARVGGGWLEMAIAGLVGLVAGAIHFGTLVNRKLDLQKSLVAAFVASLCAYFLTFVLPPFDAPRALFGGITLLVPAMVITLGTHELANDAIESGLFRLAHGLLRFMMLAAGIAAAMKVAQLFGGVHASHRAHPVPEWALIPILVAGGIALMFCLQGRRRDLGWMVAGVLLAYFAQVLGKSIFGDLGTPTVAAILLGLLGGVASRVRKDHVSAVVIIPGLLQIAPGFLGTEAVLHSLEPGSSADAGKTFFQVLLVSLQLVVGLLIAGLSVPAKPRRRTKSIMAPAR